MLRPVLASLALLGCTAAVPPDPPVAQSLAGTGWVIAAIDGRALESQPIDGIDRRPHLVFGQRSYGGHAGCNGLGGLYAQRGARIYTLPGPQTAMGCGGRRGEQEAALNAVLYSAPSVSGAGETITLTGANRRLSLRREASLRPTRDPPEAWQGPRLAGQSFELTSFDGASLSRRPAPRLSFTARTATLSGLCPKPVSGSYLVGAGTLRVTWASTTCPGARFPRGTLSHVSGPNGELLLAGDGHWVAGDNLRRDHPK